MNTKSITKELEPTGELCLKFSDEELEYLGLKVGDKFSVSLAGDGKGVLLTPYAEIDIDLSSLSKDQLIYLITRSNQNNQTIEETIEKIVEEVLEDLKLEE